MARDRLFAGGSVVGVGPIGGSVSKALRARMPPGEVVVTSRRRHVTDRTVALGAVDEGAVDARKRLSHARLTVLAARVREMPDLAAAARRHMPHWSLPTDVGSTEAWLFREREDMADDCYS